MTLENPYNHEAPLHEVLKPHESLLVMSASLIDEAGQVRDGKSTPFFDVDWGSEGADMNFQLQSHTTKRVIGSATTYFLKVSKGLTDTETYYYRYHSNVRDIDLCDEDGKKVQSLKHDKDTIPTLLGYLGSAPTRLSREKNQEFINIMVANKIKDPRIGAKARRLGSRILPRFISS